MYVCVLTQLKRIACDYSNSQKLETTSVEIF